jgi:hypothetical protein
MECHSGPAYAEAATRRQALSRNPIMHALNEIAAQGRDDRSTFETAYFFCRLATC